MQSRRVTRFDGGEPQLRSVTRRDTYRLDKSERMPNGALRVDALVTRTGVFTYHDADGKPVREYRPATEVKDQASVKTLRDTAVTVLHPNELVTPQTWDSVAVGHVSGEPVAQGDGIKASLVISSQDAIDLIEGKKVQEISCGYQVMLEDSPGTTPEGEHYDSIQRNIRYNHVAMGPTGWGRQGSSVSLRLDSSGNQILEQGDRTMKLTIIHDGQTYVVDAGSAEHTNLLAKIARDEAERKVKLDSVPQLQTKLDAVTGERDVLAKQLKETKEKLDAAPAAAVESARARLKLESSATTVLGSEFKCDGADGKPLADKDIRIAIIKKFDPDFKADGCSEDYLRAVCDTYQKHGGTQVQDQMITGQLDLPKPGSRVDAKDPQDPNDPDPEAAQAKMRKDSREASRRPLSVSTQQLQK